MKWILDTNVVAETISSRPNSNVMSWMARNPVDEMAISAVTVAEIRDGISIAPEGRRNELIAWFDAVLMPSLGERALVLTTDVLIDWLRLSRMLAAARMMRRAADLLIASTARVHELIVVTRNARHFADSGAIVYDPWSNKTHQMDAP